MPAEHYRRCARISDNCLECCSVPKIWCVFFHQKRWKEQWFVNVYL